jgi:acyl-coenzyme A thioesterase PaaI-like protein
MNGQPIQNFYDEKIAICFGCGRMNAQGLHVRTYWDGTTGTCHFTPSAHHTAFPGVVYGGILASVIDCHSIGTAVAAMYDREARTPDTAPEITCVTGNLNITYHKPTPMGIELVLRATPYEVTDRKALLRCEVLVDDLVTVSAEVVAVRVKARMGVTLGE